MARKTRSEQFVSKHRALWQDLRIILDKIRKRGFTSLNKEEIKNFPRLYRLCSSDLAQAKMLSLSPDILFYLNNLVGQSHKYLYSFPPLPKNRLKQFLQFELPHLFFRFKPFILASTLLFLLPFFITTLYISSHPDAAFEILPSSTLSQMESAYRSSLEGKTAGMGSFATSFYIQNNISIAFACFAFGMLAGLGTIFFLLYNGIVLGTISGYIIALGYGENFLRFILIHSPFELTGLILAGAAGLLLGFTIIRGSIYRRRDALKQQKGALFSLVFGSASLLLLAAFLEGFLSPQPISLGIKIIASTLCLLFLVGYFYFWPKKLPNRSKVHAP